MSREQKLKSRDKVTRKMSRDGLVERNAATGAEENISKRAENVDLRGKKPEQKTLSQVGTKRDNLKAKQRKSIREYAKQSDNVEKTESAAQHSDMPEQEDLRQIIDSGDVVSDAEISNESEQPTSAPDAPKPKSTNRRKQHQRPVSENPLPAQADMQTDGDVKNAPGKNAPDKKKPPPEARTENASPVQSEKRQLDSGSADAAMPTPDAPAPELKSDKSRKLQFSTDEVTPAKPQNRKLNKAQKQAERTSRKLEKAKSKLPAKKKLRTPSQSLPHRRAT